MTAILAGFVCSATLTTSLAASLTRATTKPYLSANPTEWSLDEFAAGAWLRENARLTDLVATNRVCDDPQQEQPPLCTSMNLNIAALAKRRAYIEGATFSLSLTDIDVAQQVFEDHPEWRDRILLSRDFARFPDLGTLRSLWADGVRFIWIDNRYEHALSYDPYARVVFSSPSQRVLELIDPARVEGPS